MTHARGYAWATSSFIWRLMKNSHTGLLKPKSSFTKNYTTPARGLGQWNAAQMQPGDFLGNHDDRPENRKCVCTARYWTAIEIELFRAVEFFETNTGERGCFSVEMRKWERHHQKRNWKHFHSDHYPTITSKHRLVKCVPLSAPSAWLAGFLPSASQSNQTVCGGVTDQWAVTALLHEPADV